MERVTGIGGLFFRARDPASLSRWYEENLGIDPPPDSYERTSWWQEAGPTVVAAMDADSPQFRSPAQQWAVNFRVSDLDAMVVQLCDAGIEVAIDPETYPNGRFAELTDPEGNAVQLWEPTGADAAGPAAAEVSDAP